MKALPWILFVVTAVAAVVLLFFGRDTAQKLQAEQAKYIAAVDQIKTQTERADLAERNFSAATNDLEKVHAAVTNYLALKDLPIHLNWGKALLGAGETLTIHNDSPSSMTLRLVWNNAVSGKKNFNVVVDRQTELGYAQNMPFTHGDSVEIGAPGYKPMSAVTP